LIGMGIRKNLTIGVTVNLEHYENLRLEVNGEVGSAGEADDLILFLDQILGRFGRADPGTAERVDSYRRRVLPGVRTDEVFTREEKKVRSMAPPDVPLVSAAPESAAGSSFVQETTVYQPPSADRPPETGPCCETCGGNVSAAEQKMSQLFTGKILCRACMKKV
jgi:hypothetical protein